MDNKRYLDKVVEYMVNSTILDYEKKIITFPFSLFSSPSFYSSLSSLLPSSFSFSVPTYSFEIYCKNTFGLTEEEIEYVFKRYRDIIKDKIENG